MRRLVVAIQLFSSASRDSVAELIRPASVISTAPLDRAHHLHTPGPSITSTPRSPPPAPPRSPSYLHRCLYHVPAHSRTTSRRSRPLPPVLCTRLSTFCTPRSRPPPHYLHIAPSSAPPTNSPVFRIVPPTTRLVGTSGCGHIISRDQSCIDLHSGLQVWRTCNIT